MGRITKSRLFTDSFDVGQNTFDNAGLLNPYLNHDTRLFIDPLLLAGSKNETIRLDATRQFKGFFGDIIRLLRNSKMRSDIAWRAATKKLSLAEAPEVCLGYGGSRGSGKRASNCIALQVIETAKEIVDLGIEDPELFGLLPLIEDGVGIDTIGDLTATSIKSALFQITASFCAENRLPTEVFLFNGSRFEVCRNPYDRRYPILLCPLDILRDLPVVKNWADIANAASKTDEVRCNVNKYIGDIWQVSTRDEKAKFRDAALKSREAFDSILKSIGLMDRDAYQYHLDPDGIRMARKINESAHRDSSFLIRSDFDQKRLSSVVDAILDTYRRLIEDNRAYDLIYDDAGKPRKEKAMQRLLYVVAQSFCEANNIGLHPETDSGGGPVDFKFSTGGDNIIVEIKRSLGSVEHGYNRQILEYEKANKSYRSILMVVDVGGIGKKVENITKVRNELVAKGISAPEIFYIDANRKASASNA